MLKAEILPERSFQNLYAGCKTERVGPKCAKRAGLRGTFVSFSCGSERSLGQENKGRGEDGTSEAACVRSQAENSERNCKSTSPK